MIINNLLSNYKFYTPKLKSYLIKKISIEEFVYKKFSKESDLNTATGKTQYLQKVDKKCDILSALYKPLKNKGYFISK